MLDQLIELDQSLLLYLNNLGTASWDGFWLVVTNKRTFIPLYIVLVYLMAKRLTTRGIIILVLTIAGMILFTDQTTNLFKFSFEFKKIYFLSLLIACESKISLSRIEFFILDLFKILTALFKVFSIFILNKVV